MRTMVGGQAASAWIVPWIVALCALATACGSDSEGGGTAATDTAGSAGGSDSSGASDSGGNGQDAAGATDGGAADTSAADVGAADVGGADVAAADAGASKPCGTAKVTLVGQGKITKHDLSFTKICAKQSNGDQVELSLKGGVFHFFWEPLTSEPPSIRVDGTFTSGKAAPLGKDIAVIVPQSPPFGTCTTKGANPPADIGTAKLTFDSEAGGSKYVFEADGKAYCYGASSGGSSWDAFTLRIEGEL